MDKYFVSYSYQYGTGCTVVETNGSVESVEDINEIIECIQESVQKENPNIKDIAILNIKRLPI